MVKWNSERRQVLAQTLEYWDAPADLITAARDGSVTLEAIAAFENARELIPGLLLVANSAYAHECWIGDASIALRRDPRIDNTDRARLVQRYEEAVTHARVDLGLTGWN